MGNKLGTTLTRLIKICFGLLLAVHVGWGQRSDTIFQQVATNLGTAPFTSANVQSIGQSQHVLYISANSKIGHVCAAQNLNAYITASFDNSFFFQLTADRVIGNISNVPLTTQIYVSGLAPFIRVQIDAFNTTDCTLNVFYAGSLYPVNIDKLQPGPNAGGYQIFSNTIAIGTITIIPHDPQGRGIEIYGVQCQARDTDQYTININNNTVPVWNFTVTQNTGIVMPPTGIGYYYAPTLNDIFATVTRGAAGVGVICTIQYRYE